MSARDCGTGSPIACEDTVDGECDAILGVRGGDDVGGFADGGNGVAHRDSERSALDHGEIVDFIADGRDARTIDVVLDGEVADGGPLADLGIEDFEEVDGVVLGSGLARVDRAGDGGEVLGDGFASEAFMHGGGEFAHDVGGRCEADADGVLGVRIFLDGVGELDLDIHDAEPPLGGVLDGAGVDDEVVETGCGTILEEQGGSTKFGEEIAEATDEGLVHLPAVEGVAGGGIADHRAAGADDGCFRAALGGATGVYLFDDVLGFDEASPGADDDLEPLPAGPGEGLPIGLGDMALGVEEGAIEIEGEEVEISGAGSGHGSEDMRIERGCIGVSGPDEAKSGPEWRRVKLRRSGISGLGLGMHSARQMPSEDRGGAFPIGVSLDGGRE